MALRSSNGDQRARDATCGLTELRTCVEIATDAFLVGIASDASWLEDLSDEDLARLADDAARLESTVYRLLAQNSLTLALQAQQASRLARLSCEVRLRQSPRGKTDMATAEERGLLGRVTPRLRRKTRTTGAARGAA